MLSVSGAVVASPTQWFNPWRTGGGGYAVTMKFRAPGTVLGIPGDGFFAHEVHFFPNNRNFVNSPYGWGGREIHWGHMATAYRDGTMIDASLAVGADGWGFALLTDETGSLRVTTELEVRADVRPNGYPERILYRFMGEEWLWRIAPNGERANVESGGLLGAEGIFGRLGDERPVVAAMGTIDWWRDGRELGIKAI
ncbi:MAG: hypothetical protein U0587_21855 [Candidatus Binatia bacterium]